MGCHHRRGPAFLVLLLLLSARIGRLSGHSVCPKGSFSYSGRCAVCKVCTAIQRQTRPCGGTLDAECACKAGYQCGEHGECGSCECAAGQERDGDGECRGCPEGKYNDQKTGRCKPWNPCPPSQVEEPGTKTRDVICRPPSGGPSQPPGPPNVAATQAPGAGSLGSLPLSATLVVALLLGVLVFLLACVVFRTQAQGSCPATILKAPLRQLAQEVDDSSCRYPEEEQGGSGEATRMKTEQLLLEDHP
uniref:TNF receptor superfamily member 9 n=1 Tax=Salvator merianae TaxID=96440 RepID=A0A8D0DWE5_SALMN